MVQREAGERDWAGGGDGVGTVQHLYDGSNRNRTPVMPALPVGRGCWDAAARPTGRLFDSQASARPASVTAALAATPHRKGADTAKHIWRKPSITGIDCCQQTAQLSCM